jgi:MYXO-CTERM domain-containing protein
MTSATDAGMSSGIDAGGPELPRVDASGVARGEDAGTWEESPSLSGGCAIGGRQRGGAWALAALALLVTWRRRG